MSNSNLCTHTETHSVPNCAVCSKLKALDGNIAETRRAMEDAFEQRSVYLQVVNRACDPIQRLPAEVASSIFVLCLSCLPSLDMVDVTLETVQNNIALQAMQFLLGSVCRHWRKVVWSTPDLWNILWLQISDRTTVTHSQMVADWLRRSGQLPLYISVFSPRSSTPALKPARVSTHNDIIDTLCHYTDRMKVLHLSLPSPLLARFTNNRNLFASSNRILEQLFIELRQSDLCPLLFPFDLGGDPCLTHLSIRRINRRAINIRWDNLTFLEAPGLFNYDALAILQLAPKLQVFNFSIVYDARDPTELPQVTHHSLRMLCLTSDQTYQFLDFITCPVMSELSYYCDLTSQTSRSLADFLRRSACLLEDLALGGRPVDVQDVLTVLCVTFANPFIFGRTLWYSRSLLP